MGFGALDFTPNQATTAYNETLVLKIESTPLYSISTISFVDSVSPDIYSLHSTAKLSATLLVDYAYIPDTLQSTGRISGVSYDHYVGSTIVAWSNVGVADFSIKRDNLAGNAYMMWQGSVLNIKKLGNSVIVYGDGGITRLKPQGKYFAKDEISPVGLLHKMALAGDETIHIFLDRARNLHILTSNKYTEAIEPQILYTNTLFASLAEKTVIEYDYFKRIIYIADGTYGYTISLLEKGFTITNGDPHITGVNVVNNEIEVLRSTIIDTALVGGMFRTSEITFGSPGMKSITTITANPPTTLGSCKVHSRVKDTWYESSYYTFNDRGQILKKFTGEAFKFTFYYPDPTSIIISDIACDVFYIDRKGSLGFKGDYNAANASA